MFMNEQFRNKIICASYESRDETPILDELASLFSQLDAKDRYQGSVSTQRLTESFGLNVHQQEDIQELARFLYQQLEEEL